MSFSPRQAFPPLLAGVLSIGLLGMARPVGRSLPPLVEPPPLEYWRAPTTQIGAPEGPFGTEVTPEGDLYTGFHEFNLTYGRLRQPGRIVSKRLLGGVLPIVRTIQRADGLIFEVEAFGTPLTGRPDGLLVDCVTVTAHNESARPIASALSAGFRYRGASVYRPKSRLKFNPQWIYRSDGRAAIRGGRLLGWMAEGYTERRPFPAMRLPATPPNGNQRYEFRGSERGIQPDTPVLAYEYAFTAPPHATHRFVFKIPHPPTPLEDLRDIAFLNAERERAKTVALWTRILDRGATFHIPDPKLAALARASVVNLFIGLDTQGPWLVPRVNELQYDGFYLRDGAFFIRALDQCGYAPEAERCLRWFLHRQRPDGGFQSQSGQLDGWGQALWALGQHSRLTWDASFRRQTIPPFRRAVAWLIRTRAATKASGGIGAGLLPPADPRDNEMIGGHLFGHDFWAYRGLWEAVQLADAEALPDAPRWRTELADYHAAIMRALALATRRTGGTIPPALEPGGYDWGNLEAVVPGLVLAPSHPWVTATLAHARSLFTEGVMTWSNRDTLHAYLGFDVPMTELRRGENALALDALLAAAAHTTGANGGFEYGSARRRDYGKNLAPHGTFAAKYISLLRDSLLREEGDTLHLGSALSPAWLRPGLSVGVTRAPSDFGPVTYALEAETGGGRLTLELDPNAPARGLKRITLHAPVGSRFTGATAEGGGAAWTPETVTFAPSTKRLRLTWTLPPDAARWTSDAFMKRYCLPVLTPE